MPSTVAPSREDAVVRAASEVAGGPAGRYRGDPRGPFTVARVLVGAVTAVMALAVAGQAHCRSTLWASPDEFTHACYSDLPALYASSGLDRGIRPYLQQADGAYLAQPVGSGGLLWLLSWLVPGSAAAGTRGRWVFDLGVLLVAAAAIALVLAVLALAGRRPWDAALVALSPVLVTASLVSLDLVAVSLATCGLWAFSRRRPVLAGVLLGAAVAVRPMALVVLVGITLVAARSGRWRTARRTAVLAAGTWSVVNLPVLAASPAGWWAFPRSLLEAPIGYGSLWLLPQLAGHPVPAVAGRWVAAGATVLVVGAVAAFALGATRRPRLPVVVLALLVGTLVVGVAVPVQASLWVLPFAALAVPRWRDLLWWGGVEAAYAVGTWFYLYGQSEPSRGLPPWAYAVLLVARVAAMGWLVRVAVRATRDVARDPVRHPAESAADAPGRAVLAEALGRDDPAAGEVEDAADAVLLRFG